MTDPIAAHLAPDLTSFAAALALGTVYPVTQWEAAIRRVQDTLEDAETLARVMRFPQRPPSGLHVTREQAEAALNRKATR